MGADKFSNAKLTLRQRISGAIMSSGIKIETADLGKLADTMEKTVEEHIAENPAVSSLLIPIESKSDFDNKVYAAVVGICEGREADKSYIGNGHHLAQEISASVVKALTLAEPKQV